MTRKEDLHLLGCFGYCLIIWHGARNSYEVVCDRAGFSGKIFFCSKIGKRAKNGPKTGFFQFIGKFGH